MAWEIETSKPVHDWLMNLDDKSFEAIAAAIDQLAESGPSLGRPYVAHIKAKTHNLKEIRSRGGNLRILFTFDPARNAILLIGGDKTGQWNHWYKQNIPAAERLLEHHLKGDPI